MFFKISKRKCFCLPHILHTEKQRNNLKTQKQQKAVRKIKLNNEIILWIIFCGKRKCTEEGARRIFRLKVNEK